MFGIGNVLKLLVWFNDGTGKPFIFDIEGTSLPGDPNPKEDRPEKWLTIKTIDRHRLPVDHKIESIFKVEQKFDIRTVPVKRLEAFAIDKMSDRVSNFPLVMSRFSEEATKSPAPAETSSKEKSSGTKGMLTPGKVGGGDTNKSSTSTSSTSWKTQFDIDRNRYLVVTKQVRRLPLAFLVVTDQSYLDEILQSVANTKLRFQTTQCEWSRFHGTLNYGGPAPTGGSTSRSGQAAPTTNREDQFSANLMEVSIYGIVSIYENPERFKLSEGL